jgi:spore maturation protein SpmA/spore maturation protein SpmB
MVLNYIWIAFFLIAAVVAMIKVIIFGDYSIFPTMMKSVFDMSKSGFEISLGLAGILTFWLGIMKIGEKGGAVKIFSKITGPFFTRLFPEIPKDHPSFGHMTMNFTATMLGLENAATPLGLKAMESLQDANPNKETASNAQIMFLVINTAGFTLLPVGIMMYRAQFGAADPSDVFIPILLTSLCATLSGIIVVSVIQKINLFDKVIIAYIGGILAICASLVWFLHSKTQAEISHFSSIVSTMIIFSIIILFIALAVKKHINVYDTFIEGAKEGFATAIKIIPFLIAILVGIGVFRASGAMEVLLKGLAWCFHVVGINPDFVNALPTALMKPLSGSGSRGMMIDTMKTYGPDAFVSRLSCIFQSACDTTFYIVALYFGSVGIKNTRYAISCGLIADGIGIIAAIIIAKLFFM